MQARREFVFRSLPSAVFAVAAATTFTAGCGRKRGKRAGSFEESARAVTERIRSKGFDASPKEFGDFKSSLPFEFDHDIDFLIARLMRKEGKDGAVKKGGWVFCVQPEAEAVATGEILGSAKLHGTDIHFLKNVTGEPENIMGRALAETGIALVYSDHIEKQAIPGPITYEWLSSFFKVPMPLLEKHGDRLSVLLRQEKTDMAGLDILYRRVTSEYGITDDRLAKMLWYLKLSIRDLRDHNQFATEADKSTGKKEFLYNVTIHELVHPKLADLYMVGNETLCILTELAYGARQPYRLANLLLTAFSNSDTETARSANSILAAMQAAGFTVERSLQGISGDEIRAVALEMLNTTCFNLTGKGYDRLVDVSLFDEARSYMFKHLRI